MTDSNAVRLEDYVRAIPDFPKPGILFRDITPLLSCGPALRQSVKLLAEAFRGKKIDVVAAAEARGFIFAAPVAIELGVGFVPVRKPGKLPFDTHKHHYDLEYGKDSLEIHVDGFSRGQRVLLVDDLLATGGTMDACRRLTEMAGGQPVACAFLVELTGLAGAGRLAPLEVFSLLKYP